MINRKLCVVVCCLGVGFAHVAQAQSSGGDDQSKALDALRQAEKGPAPAPANTAAPAPAPAPAPASSDADNAQALEALRAAEKGGPIAAPANATPAATPAPAAAPVAAAPANPEDEARALEALHSAELSQQQKSSDNAAAQLQQAQAEKKAAERARLAGNQPVPAQYTAVQTKPDDAETVAAKSALEQFELSGGATPQNPDRQSEEAALRRQHAQEEAAFRVEALQKQIKSQPTAAAPVVSGPAPDSKEGKLADLLRRYNADEITPLEYHTERAKIVAEP